MTKVFLNLNSECAFTSSSIRARGVLLSVVLGRGFVRSGAFLGVFWCLFGAGVGCSGAVFQPFRLVKLSVFFDRVA